MEDHLPPEFEHLRELTASPANQRAVWRYAVTLLLIDTGMARFVAMHQDGETLHFVVETNGGDRFSVIRPPMSEELEQALLEQVRRMISDDANIKE